MLGGPFPGKLARASLKHDASLKRSSWLGSFPGQTCPGLIEARRAEMGTYPRYPFPGQTCPGLIEASPRPELPTDRMPFPGQTCPGLIEARACPAQQVT